MTWPLIEAEMASLWQLDIPRFTARGDETALRPGPENSIAGCFADSAWNATRTKIRSLNESDLRWQLSLIAGTFDVRSANLRTEPAIASEELGDVEPLADDALLAIAVDIADEIETKAFRQNNVDLVW